MTRELPLYTNNPTIRHTVYDDVSMCSEAALSAKLAAIRKWPVSAAGNASPLIRPLCLRAYDRQLEMTSMHSARDLLLPLGLIIGVNLFAGLCDRRLYRRVLVGSLRGAFRMDLKSI